MRYLERVVLGEDRGVLSWLIRALLWPLSVVYRLGLSIFLGVYSVGLRKRHRLPVPVISVGNLTFGGTGKTPVVQALCRMLASRGKKVVILSRGHGGSAQGSVIVSDGETVLVDSSVAGDEPVLLARSLPGVAVVSGKDRRVSGDLACREFSPDVIVLDDGLQYWQLHRDLDIVVMDALRPFGSRFVMPMGDLREPIGGLRRAGVILLGNADGVEPAGLELLKAWLARLVPSAPVMGFVRRPVSLRSAEGAEVGLEWLKGRKIVAFCGIGRPDSFFALLDSLRADVGAKFAFPDHYRYTRVDVERICAERSDVRAEAIVTTQKDLARLDGLPIEDLHVLDIELDVEENERLTEYITDRING